MVIIPTVDGRNSSARLLPSLCKLQFYFFGLFFGGGGGGTRPNFSELELFFGGGGGGGGTMPFVPPSFLIGLLVFVMV